MNVIPFSNATDYMLWQDHNCLKCKRYENKSQDLAEAKCILAYHLDIGTILGDIPDWVMEAFKHNGCDFNDCQYKQLRRRNNERN